MPPLSLFCQNSGILKLPYSSVYLIYDTLTTAFSEIHACISEEGVFMRHKTSGYFLLSALLVSLILGLCILLNLRCPQAVSRSRDSSRQRKTSRLVRFMESLLYDLIIELYHILWGNAREM